MKINRVMTCNGSGYRSPLFLSACHSLMAIKTKPHIPRTNGKAERFSRPASANGFINKAYESSNGREVALLPWRHDYNQRRPHTSLNNRLSILYPIL